MRACTVWWSKEFLDAGKQRLAGNTERRASSNDVAEQPFSLDALRKMVCKELPESNCRCKGIIFAADSPEKRLSLHAVGRRTAICDLDSWRAEAPSSQIVAIGALDSIDDAEQTKQFESCLATVGDIV